MCISYLSTKQILMLSVRLFVSNNLNDLYDLYDPNDPNDWVTRSFADNSPYDIFYV